MRHQREVVEKPGNMISHWPGKRLLKKGTLVKTVDTPERSNKIRTVY